MLVILVAMQIINRNIILVGRIVAFLFFLASSGFTSVLHICAMEASGCCDVSPAGGEKPCENPLPQSTGHVTQIGSSCLANIVAGGLVGVQGTTEKDSRAQVSKPIALIGSLAPRMLHLPSISVSRHHSSHNPACSPPSVETYIMNTSFLI
jgi:hypothetical protein